MIGLLEAHVRPEEGVGSVAEGGGLESLSSPEEQMIGYLTAIFVAGGFQQFSRIHDSGFADRVAAQQFVSEYLTIPYSGDEQATALLQSLAAFLAQNRNAVFSAMMW